MNVILQRHDQELEKKKNLLELFKIPAWIGFSDPVHLTLIQDHVLSNIYTHRKSKELYPILD